MCKHFQKKIIKNEYWEKFCKKYSWKSVQSKWPRWIFNAKNVYEFIEEKQIQNIMRGRQWIKAYHKTGNNDWTNSSISLLFLTLYMRVGSEDITSPQSTDD